MAWYGLINEETGDLASVGTESMFEGGVVVNPYQGFTVITFGETGPDWASLKWDAPTRSVVPRPAPVLISRIDDIETWLMADADFRAVWDSLTAARKTRLRNGWQRIVRKLIGENEWRGESDQVEL